MIPQGKSYKIPLNHHEKPAFSCGFSYGFSPVLFEDHIGLPQGKEKCPDGSPSQCLVLWLSVRIPLLPGPCEECSEIATLWYIICDMAIENGHVWWVFPFAMVTINGYVSLPEGMSMGSLVKSISQIPLNPSSWLYKPWNIPEIPSGVIKHGWKFHYE